MPELNSADLPKFQVDTKAVIDKIQRSGESQDLKDQATQAVKDMADKTAQLAKMRDVIRDNLNDNDRSKFDQLSAEKNKEIAVSDSENVGSSKQLTDISNQLKDLAAKGIENRDNSNAAMRSDFAAGQIPGKENSESSKAYQQAFNQISDSGLPKNEKISAIADVKKMTAVAGGDRSSENLEQVGKHLTDKDRYRFELLTKNSDNQANVPDLNSENSGSLSKNDGEIDRLTAKAIEKQQRDFAELNSKDKKQNDNNNQQTLRSDQNTGKDESRLEQNQKAQAQINRVMMNERGG